MCRKTAKLDRWDITITKYEVVDVFVVFVVFFSSDRGGGLPFFWFLVYLILVVTGEERIRGEDSGRGGGRWGEDEGFRVRGEVMAGWDRMRVSGFGAR